MALFGLTVISGCNRVDEQRTGTQAHAISSVPSPQTSATPKYLEGQRVKLGDETVVVVSHKCVAETGCEYEVYFMADSEAAVRERREVKKSWVKESELGSVVPVFEIGQRVYFTGEPQSTGYITHSACNSGRCRYAVNYVGTEYTMRPLPKSLNFQLAERSRRLNQTESVSRKSSSIDTTS